MKLTDCGAVGDLLGAYVDEELTADEMQAVALHLTGCGVCREQAEDQQSIKTMLDRELVPAASEDFWLAVQSRVRAERPAAVLFWQRWGGVTRRARPVVARTLALGAATAMAIIAVSLSRDPDPVVVPAPTPDDAEALVARHAEQSTAHPLGDWSRMTFVSTEAHARTPDW